MPEFLYLVLGALLLTVVGCDFFYTTLSGSGSGVVSRSVYFLSHKLLQLGVKLVGRRFYSLSGVVVNLMLLLVWVMLVWLGLFLIYTSDPGSIVNNDDRPADTIERLYFTGYTLSTLGMGNFNPTSPFFELLTSILSFFGFIFFTTTMTYLISVSSAVIHKRSLALYIRNLGETPEELLNGFLNKDTSFCYQAFSTLQQMIDRHSVNHQAYPVLHYYGNADPDSSFSLNIAVLDEGVSLMLRNQQANDLANELQPLRRSLTRFLQHMEEKYTQTLYREKDSDSYLPKPGEIPHWATPDESAFKDRRKILGGLLRSESFGWRDVFSK